MNESRHGYVTARDIELAEPCRVGLEGLARTNDFLTKRLLPGRAAGGGPRRSLLTAKRERGVGAHADTRHRLIMIYSLLHDIQR